MTFLGTSEADHSHRIANQRITMSSYRKAEFRKVIRYRTWDAVDCCRIACGMFVKVCILPCKIYESCAATSRLRPGAKVI